MHLLSITDEGVPPDVATESNLFPISWNPMNLMGALAAIPGLPTAARIGVDSITPMMEQLLGATFPTAELVDGESLLRTVRRVKSDCRRGGDPRRDRTRGGVPARDRRRARARRARA